MRHRGMILGLGLALAAFPARGSAAQVDIRHPVTVTVTPLDPIHRGASVRFLVRSSSRIGLGRAEARLTSAGKATIAGVNRVALGRLECGRTKDATFRVVLPNSGEHTVVQFQVMGEGPNGMLVRAATFDALPDGHR